jgi:hypothetical protein
MVVAKGWLVITTGTTISADLGGRSKYSSEKLEDRSGKGFHMNSNWI